MEAHLHTDLSSLPKRNMSNIIILHIMGGLHVVMYVTSPGGAKGFNGVHFVFLHKVGFSPLDNGDGLSSVDP